MALTSTEQLHHQDSELPFDGKTALIIGGASGTGEALSKALVLKGAHVVITSRTMEKLIPVQHSFSRSDRVTPLVLDVTDIQQIRFAAEHLDETGIHPDILIVASAGGLEKLMRPMLKFLFRAQQLDPAARATRLSEFNAQISHWITEFEIHKQAFAVNFQGSVDAFEAMIPKLSNGGSVVYISSIPSSLAEVAQAPSFYYWIAQTKRMFEMHLAGRAPDLAQRDIQTAVITGGLLSDTPMGQILIQKGLPLLPEEQQFPVGYQFPTTLDMVKATLDVLGQRPETNDSPLYRWVTGKGDIRHSIDPNDPIVRFPFPA